MKKVSTWLETIDGKRTISIYVEDRTAEILLQMDEHIQHEYILAEYRAVLIDRKETRWHQSLDKSMEHGFDVLDPRADTQTEVERRELAGQLKTALHTLTDKQRYVFLRYVLDGLSFR